MLDFKRLLKAGHKSLAKHSPEILVGIGIGGFFTAIGLCIPATKTACELIEEKKIDEGVDELTPVETVKTVWKCYIPTAVTAGCSTACIVGATRTGLKRNAALAAAYKISQESLELYHEKVKEAIGEKKEREIRDEVAKEKHQRHPDNEAPVVITAKGDTNCYDPVIKREFKNDIESIRKGINNISDMISHEMSASYNDYLVEIGLSRYQTDVLETIGWDLDDFPLEPQFTYGPGENGEPCLIVSFYKEPHYIGP